MRRCSAAQKTCRSWQAKRWTSYDRSSLTDEALVSRITSSLGNDEHGKPIRIDTEKKTVSTAGGDLPISPLFEPSWIRSRKRVKKEEAGTPTGRFRRKLIRNPFARALSSPIRYCNLTQVALPRFFLQDFEVINHPETSELWFAAGPLAFEKVQPKYWPSEAEKANSAADCGGENKTEVQQQKQGGGMSGKLAAETAPPSVSAVPEPKTGNNCSIVANIKASDKRGKAPITTYTLSNKLLLDKIGNDRKSGGKLIGGRSGMAYTPASRSAVFRSDMADVVLKMMRQTLVDSLVERSAASVRHQSSCGQIVPIGSWEDAKQVKERGSLLFLQADDAKSPDAGVDKVVPSFEYATLDVDNTSYDRKMPVYDLIRLLGKDEVARLRASAPATFSQNESQGRSVQRKYVLKRKSSHSSINLHLLLWRLEGYLAENRAPAPAA